MGKYAQLVLGPAGSGKSTYCTTICRHCETRHRTVHVMNLDPAAESFDYPVSIDVRALISVEEVMEEMAFGPNGSLVFAFEYLSSHLDFLSEELQDYSDDYLLIDCPGQIELFSHLNPLRTIIHHLQREGYSVGAIYCLDATFVADRTRFVSGLMMCLSAMVHLEVPHINLLTKCDQLPDKGVIADYCEPASFLEELVSTTTPGQPQMWSRLNATIATLIDEYSLISFVPFDISDEESIDLALMQIDHAIQYGEDVEPKEPGDAEYDVATDFMPSSTDLG